MKLRAAIFVLALFAVALVAQVASQPYTLPLWNGHWNYLTLGKSFVVTGSTIDVPVTTGPSGPAGAVGPQGPAGNSAFSVSPNQVTSLIAPMAVFYLTCPVADIYRNGLMQAEGVDYSVDGTGLVATFAPAPQAGDVVKVTYRCH